MLVFRHNGQLTFGDDMLDYGLSDVEIVPTGNGSYALLAVSGQTGAVGSWSVGNLSSIPRSGTVIEGPSQDTAGQTSGFVIAADGDVAVTGLSANALTSFGLSSSGGVRGLSQEALGSRAGGEGAALSDGNIVLSNNSGNGMSVYEGNSNTSWTTAFSQSASRSFDISDMHVATVGGTDIVILASGQTGEVATYQYTGTSLLGGDSLSQQDGTGLMLPTDLASVSVDGSTYLLVGSAAGQSGVLTVLELDATGQMTQTDQIMDSRDSRFGQIQTIEAVPYQDGALLVAGGGDDGLSLFAMSENGQLTHITAFADTVQSGLTNVATLDISVVGETLHIFVASQADAGVSSLTVDLSTFGEIMTARAQGGTLTGTRDDDILFSGRGTDTLDGGAGQDLFVISEDDASADVIINFNASQDRIDLSGWNFIYDTASLEVWSTNQGAFIQHRDQLLEVRSGSGRPLSADDIRAAIDLDVTRLPTLEQVTRMGNNAANLIEGDIGRDTLSGGGGDDTVFGFGGDDIFLSDSGADEIYGGAGRDTLRFDMALDDITIIDQDGSSMTIRSSDGRDVISGVEVFEFTDGTWSFDELGGGSEQGVTRVGGGGKDSIIGGAGDDLISGRGNDDHLRGKAGDDVLKGNGGKDVIIGGGGADKLVGGAGRDKLLGGAGADSLSGGAGQDRLVGGGHNDVLSGGAGNNNLFGGIGEDRLIGGHGADKLRGGAGDDVLEGGGGPDVFFFQFGDDEDVIRDFNPNVDTLTFEGRFFAQIDDADEILDRYAEQSGRDIVFNFGNGQKITLEDISDIAALRDAINLD